MKLNISDEILKWKWAYQDQLRLLDDHDAYWIKCATNKWEGKEGVEEFGKFLTSYSLRRGEIARYFTESENLELFISRCNEVFFPALAGNVWCEAQKRWNKINREFAKRIGVVPASASLKTFWFFHPRVLPMYDTYACKSLHGRVKEKVTHENYLLVFQEFFEKAAIRHIKSADQESMRKYIYHPRVADKYLWLCGNRKQHDILRNFACGLSCDPKSSI